MRQVGSAMWEILSQGGRNTVSDTRSIAFTSSSIHRISNTIVRQDRYIYYTLSVVNTIWEDIHVPRCGIGFQSHICELWIVSPIKYHADQELLSRRRQAPTYKNVICTLQWSIRSPIARHPSRYFQHSSLLLERVSYGAIMESKMSQRSHQLRIQLLRLQVRKRGEEEVWCEASSQHFAGLSSIQANGKQSIPSKFENKLWISK